MNSKFKKKTLSLVEKTWRFNDEVASKFDTHVKQSIPHYSSFQKYIARLSEWFLKDDCLVYDLACSTGETINQLLNLKIWVNSCGSVISSLNFAIFLKFTCEQISASLFSDQFEATYTPIKKFQWGKYLPRYLPFGKYLDLPKGKFFTKYLPENNLFSRSLSEDKFRMKILHYCRIYSQIYHLGKYSSNNIGPL